VGIAGGRCPQCGTQLGELSALPEIGRLAPSVAARRANNQPSKQWLLAGAMTLLAALAIIVLLVLRPTSDPSAATSSASAPTAQTSASPPDVDDQRHASPTDSFPRAKARARAWHKEAALVSIHASPVKAGFVDLSQGGTLEFVFAVPSGGAMPGASVSKQQYVVVMDGAGTKASERTQAGGLVAAEPTCTFYDAWTRAAASGLDKAQPATVAYQHSAALSRGVWEIQRAGDPTSLRNIDGFSCTIIVR